MKKNNKMSAPWTEAIETYGTPGDSRKTLKMEIKQDWFAVSKLMEVGKYYQTSCDNGSPCFVKTIDDNTMLLAIKSPLAVLIQHGLFTLAGAKEITKETFEAETNKIIFELNTIKNTYA